MTSSLLLDYPQLNDLPEAIDGKPVRAAVLEVFSNPENGTPDNISKAGCIALALKGKEAWNAWREMFPVQDYPKKNSVDFSGVDFTLQERHDVKFYNFSFGNYPNFSGAIFGDSTFFSFANFGKNANFNCVQFGSGTCFNEAKFEVTASFHLAQFGNKTTFSNAIFGREVSFSGALFAYDMSFRGARFLGRSHFRGQTWAQVGHDAPENLSKAKEWGNARGISPNSSNRVDFSDSVFGDTVDFSEHQFLGPTTFSNTKFKGIPIFHGCKQHQDTTFENAKFPKPTGSEAAARAYRTLKLAFSQQQAVREEQRFFKLEMEEETLRETGVKRWLFMAYKTFSDFGFSVTLPLKYAAYSLAIFTIINGVLSWLGQCGASIEGCRFSPQWLNFSILQTIPLPGLDKLSEEASKVFWPVGDWWGLVLSVLVILHKTISLAALFLIGLALRNLFKLK